MLGAYHTSVIELIGQAAAYQGKVSLQVRRHKNPELLFKMAGLHLPDLDTARLVGEDGVREVKLASTNPNLKPPSER